MAESGDDFVAELVEQVHNALSDVLHNHDGAMLTRFVTIAEVIDTTGERALWLLAPRDMKAWESIGFLEYARDVERQEGD